jgi:hypothetical protein
MKYEIFQINCSDKVYDEVNRLGSHDAAAKIYPQYRAEMETRLFGSERFTPDMLKHYDKVAEVECEDLEDVFVIGNGMGDKDAIKCLAPMHSLSVGDIVRVNTGRYMMVDPIGFKEVSLQG